MRTHTALQSSIKYEVPTPVFILLIFHLTRECSTNALYYYRINNIKKETLVGAATNLQQRKYKICNDLLFKKSSINRKKAFVYMYVYIYTLYIFSRNINLFISYHTCIY